MPELKLSDKKNYVTFFHIKNQVPTKSNRCFSLVICGVGRGVSRRRDWVFFFFLRSQNISGWWLDFKQETAALHASCDTNLLF